MLSPLICRARRTGDRDARSKERGVTLALVAVALVAMIGMAALSIDIGTLYQAKAEAQRTADAAALAAARVISISGITGDPGNTSGSWQPICGGTSSNATLAAVAVAQVQWNFVGGTTVPVPTVSYGTGTGAGTDCTALAGSSFSVNPTVTVTVSQTSLPLFFARIFGLVGGNFSTTSVSATATAEAFNPSGSGTYASGNNVVPVWPRCVKPWIVPDADPVHGGKLFVNQVDGTIESPGISLGGVGAGAIGETFNLVADCNAGGSACILTNLQPQANVGTAAKPNLQYVPALVSSPAPAASSTCSNTNYYQQAIAGCDNTTAYQCGVPTGDTTTPTELDLTQTPLFGLGNESATNAECLIRASGTGAGTGQDTLVTTSFPFQIQSGSANPIGGSGVTVGSTISSSNSIVSLPIYQSTTVLTGTPNQPVTIIGFLQVFINQVNADGSLNVTVLNVAGCSNTATTLPPASPFVTGTSPVPVRLITPP
jgi:Flp pilus assembly protein TadG